MRRPIGLQITLIQTSEYNKQIYKLYVYWCNVFLFKGENQKESRTFYEENAKMQTSPWWRKDRMQSSPWRRTFGNKKLSLEVLYLWGLMWSLYMKDQIRSSLPLSTGFKPEPMRGATRMLEVTLPTCATWSKGITPLR